jgi:K+-sensing histidine kinase KdpD
LVHHLLLLRKLTHLLTRQADTEREFALQLDELPSSYLRTDVLPVLLSLASVALVTAVLFALDRALAVSLVPIAYLIPIMFAATRWGVWPSALASLVAITAADFFFFEPIYSFRIDNPQDAVDLMLFLLVALVSSHLASRLRRETEALRRRERDTQHLYEFSRRLAACFTISDLIAAMRHYLSHTLGQRAALFAPAADGHFEWSPEFGQVPQSVQESLAAMTTTSGVAGRSVTDEATQDVWLLRPVCSDTAVHGVIAINIGHGFPNKIKIRTNRIEAILEEVFLTLQRLDIGKAMDDARLHMQAQLLRDAFHGTLSHELCSPLAAIQGSVSVMDSLPAIHKDVRLRSLVDAISEEVAQLNGYIENLLNATRVTAGGLVPRPEWADPRDLVNAAIKRRARRLASHRVEVAFEHDLPLVYVDSGLIEESCGQLLENAVKYSPSGSTISVKTCADEACVIVSITDQGVGITPDEQEYLGRRSFRSQRHQTIIPGSGLGFWIAATFIKANNGTVDISSRGQGLGTTASISLPAPRTIPSELTTIDDE